MTLKTRLTLGSVLLATLIAGVISAVDLANVMHLEFDATLERAQSMKNVAAELVREALNRQRSVPLRDALRDPELSGALVNILTASRILEVAVVDPGGEILADSDQGRAVSTARKYPDFEALVKKTSWYGKAGLLASRGTPYYQLEQVLGTPEGQPLLYVRVIVAPAAATPRPARRLATPAAAQPPEQRPAVQAIVPAQEQKRLKDSAQARKREVRATLTRVAGRRLSASDRDLVKRIEFFLAQSDQAEQRGDMSQADAFAQGAQDLARGVQGGR